MHGVRPIQYYINLHGPNHEMHFILNKYFLHFMVKHANVFCDFVNWIEELEAISKSKAYLTNSCFAFAVCIKICSMMYSI